MYPALAVLQTLTNSTETTLWVGGQGGMEAALIQRAGIPFAAIPAAGVHGVGLRSLPRNLLQILRGVRAANRLIKEFKPDVLLFTGGYVAAPMALAARKIPTLLYVPDIEPGLALKFLVRFADIIAVTAPASKAFLPETKRVEITGYPTRPELTRWDRSAALAQFDIQGKKPVLLVFGGSKGARSINRALLAHLPDLLQRCEIIHISGNLDWPEVETMQKSLAPELSSQYHAFAYLHEEMGAALAAADLVVSRAGASTLGEYPLFGLPAVLVPYPYAWRYQKVNADYLVQQGAAVLLRDEDLSARLSDVVLDILDRPEELARMKQAALNLAHPDASAQIAALLRELAGGQPV